MPITYRIDARQSLVVTTISGHIHEAELRAHAAAASADPTVQACTRAIVDISQGVEVAMDSKVVSDLAMTSGEVAPVPGRKVAVIAPTDTTYGLARVFQGHRTGANASEMRVFRDRAAAEAWLRLPPQPGTAR